MNLDAVRDALLADADRRVGELLSAAGAAAAEEVSAARQRADAMIAEARREGEAEAHRTLAVEQARARRASRERLLAARAVEYRGLRDECRLASCALRGRPQYSDLLEGLARAAREQLGDGAVVNVDDEHGGLVATAGSRSVDYRLDVISDRCVVAMAAEVEELWR